MTTNSLPVAAPPVHVHIAPTAGWVPLKFQELWDYRELLYFLTWRDFKVRYKQTILGVTWAILQPVVTMVVFSLFFGKLAKMASDGLPYPIFSYAALVPWTFFAYGLTHASNSLVTSANILKKIYFPRITMPLATILSGLVDFVLAFLVLLALMGFYHIPPTANLVWLPGLVLLALITSFGVSLWLSAMNVLFRDIRYLIPFLVQIWFFVTPIAYPSSMLSEPWRTLYGLNPMAGVVEGFRWALLGAEISPGMLLASSLMGLLLLVSGVLYFSRMERTFADVV